VRNAFVSSIVSLLAVAGSVWGQVPINYQGRVTVGGTNFTGTGQFKFALVNAAGTQTFWSNGVSTVAVPVAKGVYSVMLGDEGMNPISDRIFTNADVRLQVWFDDGTNGLQKLTPSHRLGAVAYAYMSANWENKRGLAGGVDNDGQILGGQGDFTVQVAYAGSGGTALSTFAVVNQQSTISAANTDGITPNTVIRVGNGLYMVQSKTATEVTLTSPYQGTTGSATVSTGTVVHTRYTITFNEPFQGPPAITATYLHTTPNGQFYTRKLPIHVEPNLEGSSIVVETPMDLVQYGDLTQTSSLGAAFTFICIGEKR